MCICVTIARDLAVCARELRSIYAVCGAGAGRCASPAFPVLPTLSPQHPGLLARVMRRRSVDERRPFRRGFTVAGTRDVYVYVGAAAKFSSSTLGRSLNRGSSVQASWTLGRRARTYRRRGIRCLLPSAPGHVGLGPGRGGGVLTLDQEDTRRRYVCVARYVHAVRGLLSQMRAGEQLP